jgi:hypothetical protein
MGSIKAAERHLDGKEVLNETPFEPTVQRSPPGLAEQVKALVRSEQMALYAESQDHETFEESEDFELGDEEDFEALSPYETREFEGYSADPISESETAFAGALERLAERVDKIAGGDPAEPPDATAKDASDE